MTSQRGKQEGSEGKRDEWKETGTRENEMVRERERGGGDECHFNPSYFSMEKSTKTKDS